MSKITFRADADLVDRLEGFEASKSEVMREALRSYLDGAERSAAPDDGAEPSDGDAGRGSALDNALAARVDELVAARLDEALGPRHGREGARPFGAPAATPEVNLTVNVDGTGDAAVEEGASDTSRSVDPSASDASGAGGASDTGATACVQCGEGVSEDHVYCPNCGEKASRRLFCECGDELRSDWGFCPGCGRRTPAADVLEGR